jgi:rhodanese-related sulfurtransferase
VEELLADARARFVRLTPAQAAAAQVSGGLLIDIRGDDQRRSHGCIPRAICIPRNVLEWRADPACPSRDLRIADRAASLVLVCQEGFQSSLAASVLHDLGLARTTDLDGGFEAWRAAGLPIEDVTAEDTRPRST